ncbi:MAG: hypothetical protein WC525_08935 [Candidatus Thermoplasmatota archaeon]
MAVSLGMTRKTLDGLDAGSTPSMGKVNIGDTNDGTTDARAGLVRLRGFKVAMRSKRGHKRTMLDRAVDIVIED